MKSIKEAFCLTTIMAILILASCSSEKPTYLEPRLSTLAATDVTRTEATLNGKVHIEGDTEMPQLYFRYGTTEQMSQQTPSINLETSASSTRSQGANVSLPIDHLSAGSTYYYMLQGSNGRNTIMSNQMTFSTQPNVKPTLGETKVLSHGPMSAIIGYEIIDNGGENITETGCYIALSSESNESEKPSGNHQKVVLSQYQGSVGTQRLLIDNLQGNTTYQITPYALNRVGETIGEDITLTTSDAIVLGEPGGFSALMGSNLYEPTTMALAGLMNGDDLRCLRKMMGRNSDGTSTPGRLAHIDMTDVKIVAGGGPYDASRYTQDHVIGQGLFANCNYLAEILLPNDATTLEKDAFANCTSLTQIEIPATIDQLQPSSGCVALQSIHASSANTHYCSQDGVLLNGDGTSIVWFPMGKQGNYTLPSTITHINSYAFKECCIEKITLPDRVTSMGQGAFMDSKVKEVRLSANLKTLPASTFQGCTQLKVVKLGSKMELISDYAFDQCPLTDLYIEATIPPVCSDNAFTTKGTSFLSTCTLHVPAGKASIYKASEGWKQFKNIITY